MRSAPLPRGLLALALLGLAMVLGLTSCAGDSTTTITNAAPDARLVILTRQSPADDEPAQPVATPATRPPAPVYVPSASRDDLLRETRATPIQVVRDPDDSRLVHVRYLGGAPTCHGARVAVDDGTAMIRIVLFTGFVPEASGVACPAVSLPRQVDVRLDRPLGTRELVAL